MRLNYIYWIVNNCVGLRRESMTFVLWISPWLRMAILTSIKDLCLKS